MKTIVNITPLGFFILVLLQQVCFALPQDKISVLPGQPQVSFQQFSGYVSVDDDKLSHKRALFYYFAEAQIDPASKPLVLWLNGGLSLTHIVVFKFVVFRGEQNLKIQFS